MGERACPLRMVGNNEAVSVLESTRVCIKEKCAWWLNPYKQEKGKKTKEGECAVAILALDGFNNEDRLVIGRQARSFEQTQKELKALIGKIVARREDAD